MRYFSKRCAQEETMFPYVSLLFSKNGSFSFVTLFMGKCCIRLSQKYLSLSHVAALSSNVYANVYTQYLRKNVRTMKRFYSDIKYFK